MMPSFAPLNEFLARAFAVLFISVLCALFAALKK